MEQNMSNNSVSENAFPTVNNELVNPLTNDYGPIKVKKNIVNLIDIILKHPAQVLYDFNHRPSPALTLVLTEILLFSLIIYGTVVGSFSGGHQYWIASIKIALSIILSALICLPSLYIFLCLNGAEAKFFSVFGGFLMSLALCSLLLVGFAPVAWVFSQSTNSILFMSILHLCFFSISLYFGLRTMMSGLEILAEHKIKHLKVWIIIFIMVLLQMTTTLRPILGTSSSFFPQEKKFFLVHYMETLGDGVEQR